MEKKIDSVKLMHEIRRKLSEKYLKSRDEELKVLERISFLKKTPVSADAYMQVFTRNKNPGDGKKARRAEMIIEPWENKIHNPEGVK